MLCITNADILRAKISHCLADDLPSRQMLRPKRLLPLHYLPFQPPLEHLSFRSGQFRPYTTLLSRTYVT